MVPKTAPTIQGEAALQNNLNPELVLKSGIVVLYLVKDKILGKADCLKHMKAVDPSSS